MVCEIEFAKCRPCCYAYIQHQTLDIKDPKESDFAKLASDLRLMARAASIWPVLCNASTLVSPAADSQQFINWDPNVVSF